MGPEIVHSVKQIQSTALGLEVWQAIRVLSLGRMEMLEAINCEMAENPLLEEEIPGEVDSQIQSLSLSGREDVALPKETLAQHLLGQFRLEHIDPLEQRAAQVIVHNLDEDGRLVASPEELAAQHGLNPALCRRVQEDIKGLDPVGCASEGLVDCLLAQAQHSCGPGELPLLENMIRHHLEDVALGNREALIEAMGQSWEGIDSALLRLQQFHPKPGRLISPEAPHYIVPDVFVRRRGDEFLVEAGESRPPGLRLAKPYAELLRGGNLKNPGERAFVEEKLRRAHLLLKALEKRQETILRVARCLVDYQEDFFCRGQRPDHLRPLRLKDVAFEIGTHESTVSRAVVGKYIQMPSADILEFKYFFPKVGPPKNLALEHKIRQLCALEPPDRPFSDRKMAALLERGGIKIGVKALGRYREELGILPSSKRKGKKRVDGGRPPQ